MPNPSLRILLKDNIHPDPDAMHLCIDVGIEHIGLSLHLVADNSLIGYEFYSFPDSRNQSVELEAALIESSLATIRVGHVRVIYNTPDSVIVPDEIYKTELVHVFLEAVHGDLTPGTILLEDHLENESIRNIYRIPVWIQQELNLRFRNAPSTHALTAMLAYTRKREPAFPEDCIHLWFYPRKALALITHQSKVMMLQSISYEIPEDLSYTVLNACERYGMDPMALSVYVSGLVENDSIVYNELFRYFNDIIMDDGGVRFVHNDFFSGYPSHYFTPAFQLNACAS